MGSSYVLIKAHSARATDAIGKEHRASRRQGFMRARGGATQKPSDDRFGGELTSHCYSDGGASAPKAAVLPVVSRTTRLWVLRGPRVGWRSALLQDTQRREYDRAHSSRNSESASAAAAGPLLSVIARFAG